MIRISQLKLPPDAGQKQLEKTIRRALSVREHEAFTYEVIRRSIDARKKPKLYEVFTVLVQMQDTKAEQRILRAGARNIEQYEPILYRHGSFCSAGQPKTDFITGPDRPLIIGTGPAGLFCGLLLAREGFRPILIERGQRARERTESIRSFWDRSVLDPESNVQFGEGGAGTFSDGKLNTGIRDPEGRIRFVLETFVQAGADAGILSDARPHVGTDVLKKVVTALTDEITERGGEVYFSTRMDRILHDSGRIWEAVCTRTGHADTNRREETVRFRTKHLVLAIGHSARDTFRMLSSAGIIMHPKAFAVGVRIQHPQALIDCAMYGETRSPRLPAASYRLTHRLAGGRGVYSFCMCPGGYVVNASSEEGHLAVNGMSFHDRSSGSANSAIVVTVSPEEIADCMASSPSGSAAQPWADQDEMSCSHVSEPAVSDPLLGMEFQRRLERAAFQAGAGSIPAQRFCDFAAHAADTAFSNRRFSDYEPQICGRWKMTDIRHIFPAFLSAGIEEGIISWNRQIEGFASPDALLCAAESRTSSPVRIERTADLQAAGHPGLYPCGEGAGYAGGITSAAVDGLRVAEQILRTKLT